MGRFLLRRTVTSILMLVTVSILIFVVLRLLPGDPIITRLGATPGVDPKTIQALRKSAGLDSPLVLQYLRWVGGVVHGDFGQSYFNQYSVGRLIAESLPSTLELTALSMLMSIILAVPLGILAALRPRGFLDRMISTGAAAGLALPQFLVGIMLILVFAVRLHWLPARGAVSFSSSPVQHFQHLILPSLTLAIAATPLLLRFLRSSMVEVLGATYIRTAEGKGASRLRVVIGHAFRNAMIPSLTVLGLIVGYTLGGVVIIEYIFGLPGLGSLAVQSVFNRDYAVLQSVTLLISAMFILTSLVVDLLYGILDPRLRVARARA